MWRRRSGLQATIALIAVVSVVSQFVQLSYVPEGRCVAVSVRRIAENVTMLPVHAFFTPAMSDLAENLVVSMIRSTVSDAASLDGIVVPCVQIMREDGAGTSEATFGSNDYYGLLRKKLSRTRDVIRRAALAGRGEAHAGGRVLPIVAFLDADSQVFSGWFERVILPSSGLRTWPTAIVRHAMMEGVALSTSLALSPGDDTRPGHAMYFQRESRKRLNSGVMIVHALHPDVPRVFDAAEAAFRPKAYGDQTALQIAVARFRRKRDRCPTLSAAAVTVAGTNANCGLSYGMLNKSLVNAGLAEFQRDTVLIHHAHMSGRFKRENLRAVQAHHGVSVGPSVGHLEPQSACPPEQVIDSTSATDIAHAVHCVMLWSSRSGDAGGPVAAARTTKGRMTAASASRVITSVPSPMPRHSTTATRLPRQPVQSLDAQPTGDISLWTAVAGTVLLAGALLAGIRR